MTTKSLAAAATLLVASMVGADVIYSPGPGSGSGGLPPLAGTGLDFTDPESGLDSFIEVFEAVPEVIGIGPIGSTTAFVKDVAVDPTTGRVYTIDLVRGEGGQQVYEVHPGTGAGRALPNLTMTAAPDLIWGLAFDDRGNLFGGGLGVFAIDKDSGVATPLADLATVPALIFGMANSSTGTGFTSTGVLLVPKLIVPYVAEHAADGSFVSGTVSLLIDLSGTNRLLFDIGLSDNGLLYGNTVPRMGSATRATGPSQIELPEVEALLTAAWAQSPERRRIQAEKEVDKVYGQLLGPTEGMVHADMVLVFNTPPYAFFTNGAPLDALLLGLGGSMTCADHDLCPCYSTAGCGGSGD